MPPARETRLDASGDLRRWIGEIALMESSAPRREDALYTPRAEASILVRWTPSGEAIVSVLGPLTRARRKSFAAPRQLVQVMFRAGRSRAFLGTPVDELADEVVPIDDVWGDAGKRLRDHLASSDVRAAVRILETALVGRVDASGPATSRASLLARAMDRFAAGAERVAPVATALGVSDRHLRRLFRDELGMTPKHFGRIARIRRVLARAPSTESWAHVAIDAGFHDQSHLIREFRDLLQVTPEAYRKGAVRGEAPPPLAR